MTACVLAAFVSVGSAQQKYYVATNGLDSAGGTTWTTALRTISNAVAKASEGDTVWVSNGTFLVSVQITLTKGIAVRSTNGPAFTRVARNGSAGDLRVFSISNAAAVLDGMTITNGYLSNGGQGAGVYLALGTVRRCHVTANKTWGNANGSSYGSGIYMKGGLVEESVVSSNWTGAASGYGGLGYGGGIYMTGGTVRRCTVVSNTVRSSTSWHDGRGGGIYMTGGAVENSLIIRNEGPGYGGGIAVIGSGARVVNCTVSENMSWNDTGAGIYISAGNVTNTIIYHNTRVLDGYHMNVNRSGGTFKYCCSTPLLPGTGNISAEPDFMNRSARSFRLLPGSACLDAGTNILGLTTDYDGGIRPLDGDGVGPALYDIGAYEENTPASRPFTANVTAPIHDGVDSLTVVLTASVSGNTNGLYHWWDFTNDGTNDVIRSTLRTVTNIYGPGYHSVKLSVSNITGAVTSVVKTAYVRVLGSTNYLAKGGGNVFPYVTWAGAATSLYAAVNAAIDGGVVLVSNGNYTASNVQLSRGILLRGVNGRAVTAINSGNRILIAHSNAVMEHLTIARAEGIYMTVGTVRHCNIVSNYFYGTAGGGGIRLDAGAVYDCTIGKNTNWGTANSTTYGGGVRMLSGFVSNCTISGNWAGASPNYGGIGSGGGVYMTGGTLANCVVVSNDTRSSTLWEYGIGGGVWISAGKVVNCLIAKNSGPGSAGGVALSGSGRLLNLTVAGNTTRASAGGGLAMSGGSVTNTIVYLNKKTSDGSTANVDKSGGTFSYSCAVPSVGGISNRAADPVFTDAANLNYRLSPGSPCIDAGTNTVGMITDLVWTNRPIDGNDDGTPVVDMGAYEAQRPADLPFQCGFSAPTNEGVDSLDAVFTASVAGNTNGIFYRWDFKNDGGIDASGSSARIVTNTYGPGRFSVKLIASNQVGAVTNFLWSNYIVVLGSIVYASPYGSHNYPFVSWATASTNLQDAVNAAPEGATFMVSNGVYTLPDKLIVGKGICIRGYGEDGPAVVQGDYRIEVKHSDAVLEKLTITGTKGIDMTAGTVRDCLLYGNYLAGTDGGAGIRMASGLIERCLIRHNRTYASANAWSYGGGLYLTGGRVRSCLIVANEATTSLSYGGMSRGGGIYISGSAIVENCTVSGNSVNKAISEGAGIYRAGGTVTNTIVWDNTNITSGANSDIGGTWPAGFSYCCSPGFTGGKGNITSSPLFASAGTGYGYTCVTGNYHLLPGSSCLHAGTNMPWMEDAVDLDGNPRRYYAVDLGAYEVPAIPGMTIIVR